MKFIPGYEKEYSATTDGRIFSHKKNKFMAIQNRGNGYYFVGLSKNGIRINLNVHRAVASTFIPNKLLLPCVNHIDGDKKNNCVENLEWVTRKENMSHSVRTGLSNRGTKPKSNTSGYVGVHKLKANGRYRAHITVDWKTITVGWFDEAIDAALARDEASLIYHGLTGKLNFPLAI